MYRTPKNLIFSVRYFYFISFPVYFLKPRLNKSFTFSVYNIGVPLIIWLLIPFLQLLQVNQTLFTLILYRFGSTPILRRSCLENQLVLLVSPYLLLDSTCIGHLLQDFFVYIFERYSSKVSALLYRQHPIDYIYQA